MEAIYKNVSLEDLKDEVWVDIIDFEGLYQISNLGRIKRLARIDKRGCKQEEKILKQSLRKNGYLEIKLCKDGKHFNFRVHRLVALMFIENSEDKAEVNHLNCNRSDNRVVNLQWVTRKENNSYDMTRKNRSESLKNRTLSEEHKKHISESMRKHYAK